MKKKIFILSPLISYQLHFAKNSTDAGVSGFYDKPCQQCTYSLQDAKQQIADLEKRLHVMQEDLRKWMKAYSDEVASKSSFYQKILGDLTDMYNKYVSTEIKLSKK